MKPQRRLREVLYEARVVLHLTQRELGEAVDAAPRTVGRWEVGRSRPIDSQLVKLARLLYPVDRERAAEVADHARETVVSLGLEAPPAGPARVAPEDLVDVLVLAGMVESGGTAEDVRRWIYAVLRRAKDIGMSLDDAEQALRPPPRVETESKRGSRVRVAAEPTRGRGALQEREEEPPGRKAAKA